MLTGLSQRLLTVLQLTRMALVFTAIADAQCGLLLRVGTNLRPGQALAGVLRPEWMLAVGAISVGLYGFGMSYNDIIDRRRDQQIAAFRPLPSGRIGILTAHLVCVMLAVSAAAGGVLLYLTGAGAMPMVLVGVTLGLIAFYDLAGKYLVGPGLLALGLVRFFQALVPAARTHWPYVPVVWHPLWLLNHVAILSTVCYWWEEKRPALTRRHWWGVFGWLAAIDAAVIAVVGSDGPGSFVGNLGMRWQLLMPVAASALFVGVAWRIRRTSATRREAGQKAMLYGLLWLIVYDASFVAAYVSWAAAGILLALLPVAYFSVQLMRWWSKIVAASHRPEFKRAKA
jgi:hypothetical protein